HFDQVEHLGDGLLAVTSTAKSPDLFVLNASNPDAITEEASLSIGEASGMALHGSLLYVVSHSGTLTTVDVSNPLSPTQIHQTTGLTSAREIVILEDKAYVADNSEGLVVIDLSVPTAPVVGASVPTTGGAQDIAQGDGVLFLACGTAGVEIFSIEDPDLPVSLGVTPVGGPVISVSASDGRVWTANHEGVQVLDVSDPTSAVLLGGESTPSWAMAVHAEGTQVYLADWNAVSLFQIDPSVAAPHADPSNDELYFTAGAQTASVTLWNRGAATLEIVGMETADARVSAEVSILSIPPGQGAEILITFQDDGDPLDTTLCLATNDPDEPLQSIALATSSDGSSVVVGEPAPDFILPDLQGTYHRLSEQQGHPVVLCYFATW
ncbi:MAG: hypothetical protein VX938_08225, partial [Myxococcota bacterium]|nr:hypothetical protein [Myxococcota bacterium]